MPEHLHMHQTCIVCAAAFPVQGRAGRRKCWLMPGQLDDSEDWFAGAPAGNINLSIISLIIISKKTSRWYYYGSS
jgi:hypothetical protein